MPEDLENTMRYMIKIRMLTVTDLAEKADVSRPTVYKWLKNERVRPEVRESIVKSFDLCKGSLQGAGGALEGTIPLIHNNCLMAALDEASKDTYSAEPSEQVRGQLVEDRLFSLLNASARLKDLLAVEVSNVRENPGCHKNFKSKLQLVDFDLRAAMISLEELTST